VLIYTGGVDTYKMGLHAIYVTLAQRLGITLFADDRNQVSPICLLLLLCL
jgi:hypothetical protein